MQLLNFLRLILPTKGFKCWASIDKNKKVHQGFVETFEQLEAEVLRISQAGLDAYFGCASFKDASSRKAANALAMRDLWADIDCGKGKPYATAEDGIQAVDAFANRRNLPLPLVVYSGTGIHVHWPLTEEVTAEWWASTAKSFKRALEVDGVKADPSRTADAASILRPPGTFNFKHGRAESVTCAEWDGELTNPEVFRCAVERPGDAKEIQPAIHNARNVPAHLQGISSLNAAVLNSAGKGLPSMTQGFPDGERTAALAARAGYLLATGHTETETLRQCRAWNQFNTPPKDDAKLAHDIASYAKKEREKVKPAIVTPEAEIQRPKLPDGFSAKIGGPMFAQVDDGEGVMTNQIMCAYELYLMDVCRKESENHSAYVFMQWHPSNGWHEFCVTTEEFASSNCAATMAKNNTNILNLRQFKQYVSKADVAIKASKMDAIQYEQFGWKEDNKAFLVGNALIREGGEASFAYGDKQLTPRMAHMKLRTGTSLAQWSSAANKLFAPGFEAHAMALISSFAAPLMKFVCGDTDGGAILALHSKGSGFGKTCSLEAVSSVWGSFDACSTAGKDTINAKFNIISRLCNLPVCEEELGQRDPVKATEFIKDFTMGRDKNRAQRDGSVQMKNSRYQTIMISASNFSLYDIAKQGGDEGAVARVFELPFTIADKEAFKYFSSITSEMLQHSGHAGRQFIYGIMQPGMLDWIKENLKNAVAHYIKLLETKAEHRYVVYLMATNLVAAGLLNHFGILNFDVQRIMSWATDQARERVGDQVSHVAASVLGQFINEHVFDCITADGPNHPKKPCQIIRWPTRRLVMRLERDNYKLYVDLQVLREWLRKMNYDYKSIENELRAANILLDPKRQTTLSAGTDWPPTRVPCWDIDASHPEIGGIIREHAISHAPGTVISILKKKPV